MSARGALTQLLAAGLLLTGSRLFAGTSADCLGCHGDPALTVERKGLQVSLHVNPSVVSASVHKGLECGDCHSGFDPSSLPHRATIEPVRCVGCHMDGREKHAFHARMSEATGNEADRALSCKGCHGTHEVASPRGPGGKFSRPRLTESCGACHGEVALRFVDSDHGKALAADARGAPDCLTCHSNPVTAAREPNAAQRKVIQERLCFSCHLDDPNVRTGMGPSARFVAEYEKSVHGSAVLSGKSAAANCVDCHGSHEMKTGMDPSSRVSKARIPATCATCHGEIAWEYAQSIHGLALKRGVEEAPVCTDCHGEHDIYPHDDPRSPVAAANVSMKVCTPCHGSLRLTEKFEMAADRTKTYADSYHGLAVRGGSVEAANCASCHGAHNIKPSSDPTSMVHKANLATTCGKCHPGANEKFAVGAVHIVLTARQEPVLYWVATLYIGMIVFVVGGMVLHNLLDFLRKTHRRLHAHRNGLAEERVPHSLYVRMTLSERLQHGALVLSFSVLAVTGFMLRYPEAWWVVWLRSWSTHLFEWRSLLHRIAGVVLVSASLFHVGYVSFTVRGRRLISDLVPRRQDVFDVGRVLLYNLGISKARPRFGRFSYIEKSEYWALVWGTIVMAATGAILWFDNTFMGILAKLGIDVARTIHFYEAVLATLAILVWHIYYVVFNPDVYPMSFAWLTGAITEREMAEEHPLELEVIQRRRVEEARARMAAETEAGLGDDPGASSSGDRST